MGYSTVERSEVYRPDDSRTATLDLKKMKRGQAPYAETDDDRYNQYDDVSQK